MIYNFVLCLTGGMGKTGGIKRKGEVADRQESVSKHLLHETEQWVPLGMENGPIWLQFWVMRLH